MFSCSAVLFVYILYFSLVLFFWSFHLYLGSLISLQMCQLLSKTQYRSSLWSSICSLAVRKLVEYVCIDTIFLNPMIIFLRLSEKCPIIRSVMFQPCLFFYAYKYLNFSFCLWMSQYPWHIPKPQNSNLNS